MRLSTRTGLAAMAAALLAVIMVTGAVLVQFQLALHERVDQQLRERAETAPILVAVGDRISVSELNPTLDGARVVTTGGTVEIGRLPSSPLPPIDEPGWRTVTAAGEQWRVYTVRVENVPAAGDTARVDLVAPLGDVNARARFLRRRSLLIGVVVALLAGGIGMLLGRRAARPLSALRNDAAGIGSGEAEGWGVRPSYGTVEVDDLATALNTGLDRLGEETRRRQAALDSARSFAAAASHELRTPLQGAMTQLDLALSDPTATDTTDPAGPVRAARQQLDRMASSLSAVRALTEVDLVDAGWFAESDLAEVTDQAVAAISSAERGSGTVSFAGDEEAPCRLWADGARLAIENVVRNAFRHGGVGATVGGLVEVMVPTGRSWSPSTPGAARSRSKTTVPASRPASGIGSCSPSSGERPARPVPGSDWRSPNVSPTFTAER